MNADTWLKCRKIPQNPEGLAGMSSEIILNDLNKTYIDYMPPGIGLKLGIPDVHR